MTFNYYIECPLCGKITRMRSPGGYIYSTPVRIHCYECNTLITGEFVSEEREGIAYFNPNNCCQKRTDKYDFYGEASADVITHKICIRNESFDDFMPFLSPAMLFMNNMEIERAEEYIDYACHISEIKRKWDNRRIIYDLFLNKKYDIIKTKFKNDIENWGVELTDWSCVYKMVFYEYLYDFGYIFGRKELKKLLLKINYEIYHLDNECLEFYINDCLNEEKIESVQVKMFSIMSKYIDIALYIMPALSTMFYTDPENIDKKSYGISTCTFLDIKNFYQDSFEDLAVHCDVIKCLDNIKYRGNYNDFGGKMDLKKYLDNTSKGNKIKALSRGEFFSDVFGMKVDTNELRNAIGHNNYSYNGIDQEIKYHPSKDNDGKECKVYLLDVAVECIGLMRSSMVLEYIIFLLFLKKNSYENKSVNLHPLFYSRAHRNNLCPCGSGKKYYKCCKKKIEQLHKVKEFILPHKSNMRFDLEDVKRMYAD